MSKPNSANGFSTVTLTSQLHEAVTNSDKRWNKDHIKKFFKPRLEKPLNDSSAIAVMRRVELIDGMKVENVCGKLHLFSTVSLEAKKCLNNFLYGKKIEAAK